MRIKSRVQIVNISSLERFDGTDVITPEKLRDAGIIKSIEVPVKILGTGDLGKSLTIKAHAFSKSAEEKIKKAGGKAEEIK